MSHSLSCFRVFVVILSLLWLMPATAVWAQKARIKHLYSIAGSAQTGPLGLLGGVFFDEEKDRLYVTDSSKDRILAFDSDFRFLSEFTGGGALNGPTAIVRDSRGRFFVAQPTTGQVLVIDMARQEIAPLNFSDIRGQNPVHPASMAIDAEDRLYLADRANDRILVFGPDLQLQKQLSVPGHGGGLGDVAVDADGRIYALNRLDGSIHVFDDKGRLLLTFGKRGSEEGEFRFPAGIAEDGRGRIFIVDQHASKISVFHRDGRFLHDFAQLGWREGRLHYPSQIFINKAGKIFVVDRQNARVSIFE